VADVIKDLDLLGAARKAAFTIVDHDPDLSGHPDLANEIRAVLGESVEWLFKS
jgi:hypothetical protein